MNKGSFARFCSVGLLVTLIDIVIFLVLRQAGLPLLVANICSTSIALAVSLLLNSRFTFRSSTRLTSQQVLTFIAVTLTGLWLIQPLVMSAITGFLPVLSQHGSIAVNLLPKIAATGVTVIWNYILYSKLVYTKRV